MRALACGSIVLALAVVLIPWGAPRLSTRVQMGLRLASLQIGDTAPRTHAPQTTGDGDLEASTSGIGTSDRTPVESGRPAARLNHDPQRSVGETAKRLAEVPAAGVRQFTPDSRAHAGATASRIGSAEFEDKVAPLARLYFAFFDRVADYEGLDYYIGERDDGTPLESIAEEFAGSLEIRLRYGSLDNAAFVDRVYRNVFDASPDAAQRAYWLGQLDAGMSRGQVMLAFSESGAFRTATNNEVFVTMAYAETLQRAPDPAGFARWVSFLEAGNPREAVIAGLLAGGRATR